MRLKEVCIAIVLVNLAPSSASAEITTFMDAWDFIPRVQITQGRNQDCANNSPNYDSSMQKGYRQPWPGTGSQGDDICWRRTADPYNGNSGMGDWNRCASDGDCEIN
jgi:hypothetical protein